jgi:TolA-binding protein
MTEQALTSFLVRRAFFAALLCFLMFGCRSAEVATASDDTFFKPLRSVDRATGPGPSETVDSVRLSSWTAKADSLLRTMHGQQQRLDGIAAHLKRLEASQRQGGTDSSFNPEEELPKPSVSPSPRGETRMPSYDDAVRLCGSRRYQEAIDAFEALLHSGVQEDLQDNCYFWIGSCRFSLGQLDLAIAPLQRVVKWRGSNKRADAYYMLGRTYEQLGNAAQAKSMFEALLKEYPRNALASSARRKLESLEPAK